jgi:hypothetical protein
VTADPLAPALLAAASRAPYAPLAVLALGAATSLGPCAATRTAALAACGARGRAAAAAALFLGTWCAFALIGAFADAAAFALDASRYAYAFLGLVLAGLGVRLLVRTRGESCAHGERAAEGASPGPAFLLGAGSVFVVSPCCTPLVMLIAALTAGGDPRYALILLGAFALGHVLPACLFHETLRGAALRFRSPRARAALAAVGAGVLVALGGYYAWLA